MLATFGLSHLEASLDGDTVSPEDVAEFLEQAKADCAKPAARTREEETYPLADDDDSYVYVYGYGYGYREHILADPRAGLPVRAFSHGGSNTEFQPTRHAFRV
jgi:hypothetical protein